MAYCTNCGKQLSDTARFCSGCGTPIENGATPPPPSYNPPPPNVVGEGYGGQIVGGRDPLYRVECEYCHCIFEYRTHNLGYRAWYPSGFVYCPRCKKPLRHKLEYEVFDK